MSLPPIAYVTATIANNASLSNAVPTGGQPIVGIQMPAAWTTADLTFQAACDAAANVANVYDSEAAELTVQADASEFVIVDPTYFAGAAFVKVRSGTAASAVNQGAERKITLALRTV
jgi:hypothetical protein